MEKLKTPIRRRRLSRLGKTHLATAQDEAAAELSFIAREASAAIEAADDTKHDEILDQAEAAALNVPGISQLPDLPPDPMPEQEVESLSDHSQDESKDKEKQAPKHADNNPLSTMSALEIASLALNHPHKLMVASAPSYTFDHFLPNGDLISRKFEHSEYEEMAAHMIAEKKNILDCGPTFKFLSKYCTDHSFSLEKPLAKQMQGFLSSIIEPRIKHIYEQILNRGWVGYAQFAINELAESRPQYLIPFQQVAQIVTQLHNCIVLMATTAKHNSSTMLSEELLRLPSDLTFSLDHNQNPLHLLLSKINERINEAMGHSTNPIFAKEAFNYNQFRSASDPKNILHTSTGWIASLIAQKDCVNLMNPSDDAMDTKELVTDTDIVTKVLSQVASCDKDPQGNRYDYYLSDFAREINKGTYRPSNLTLASLISKSESIAELARRDGWKGHYAKEGTETMIKADSHPAYTSSKKVPNSGKETKALVSDHAEETGGKEAQLLALLQQLASRSNNSSNSTPPKGPSKRALAQAATALAMNPTSTAATKGGSGGNGGHGPAFGKNCNRCGSTTHNQWTDCHKHSTNTGITSPYLGKKGSNGEFLCITCGSNQHRSADCDQPGYDGLGGPKYKGEPQPPQTEAQVKAVIQAAQFNTSKVKLKSISSRSSTRSSPRSTISWADDSTDSESKHSESDEDVPLTEVEQPNTPQCSARIVRSNYGIKEAPASFASLFGRNDRHKKGHR